MLTPRCAAQQGWTQRMHLDLQRKKETFKGCSIHAGPVVGSKLFELVVYMATAESPRQNADVVVYEQTD